MEEMLKYTRYPDFNSFLTISAGSRNCWTVMKSPSLTDLSKVFRNSVPKGFSAL